MCIEGLTVALSVCADFTHAEHPSRAAAQGAQVYATSVLIGETGHPHDSTLLQGYAKHLQMAVLMSNHGGSTGGWASAGKSAFWDEQGQCVATTSGTGNRLLIITKKTQGWKGVEEPLSVAPKVQAKVTPQQE